MAKQKESARRRVTKTDWVLCVILSIGLILILYPFYNALLISLSSERAYLSTPFMIIPKEFNFDSYLMVFSNESLWSGYKITVILVVVGTAYQLFFTVITGYAMSRSKWPGKNIVMDFILVTMFFGGGLIPYYYLIKDLGLYNTLAVMIIPGAIDTYNMLLIRNYFQNLPISLEESAKIDGANDIIILWKIFLPLATPMLATIGLFFAIGHWNQWYNAMLFIDSQSLKPLQLVLRELVVTNTTNFGPNPVGRPTFTEGLKMASIFFTIIPVMCIYPFIQRFFVKGLVVGAIKG